MNEKYKKLLEGGNLITNKGFNVTFPTAVEAAEMERLVRDIRSLLGIKKRSAAVLEIVKLARERLEDTNRGEAGSQSHMNSDSEARWFAEGIKALLRVLTKRAEAMEKELRAEYEARARWYRESVQALNDKVGILQEEKKLLETYVAVLQTEAPELSKADLDGKVLAYITAKEEKGDGMTMTQ